MRSTARLRLCVIGIAVWLLVGVAGQLMAQSSGSAAHSALYLQHVGESDKPILPLVISAASPPVAELDRILGEVEAAEALIVVVSDEDMGKIVGLAKVLLGGEESSPSRAFGTFRVTVVEAQEELDVILAKDRVEPLLRTLELVAGDKYDELQDWLSYVRRRLGSEEGP